jgi:hypothetical protein
MHISCSLPVPCAPPHRIDHDHGDGLTTRAAADPGSTEALLSTSMNVPSVAHWASQAVTGGGIGTGLGLQLRLCAPSLAT